MIRYFDEEFVRKHQEKMAGIRNKDAVPAPSQKKVLTKSVNKIPCPTEEVEQVALAQFLDLYFRDNWFHVPNGGLRNKAEGGKLKAQGVKAGVLDNWIVRPVKGTPGVIIELKRVRGGVTSPDQKRWIETLTNFGWICRVCAGADMAIKFVRETYNI
jgi:hypothetical protein